MKKRILAMTLSILLLFSIQTVYADTTETTLLTEAGIKNSLEIITKWDRFIGTEGEQRAAAYLQETFKDLGLAVKTQRFKYTDADGIQGKQTTNQAINIIATKKASIKTPDILIISAHYDTVPGTTGANDNGSGCALLTELAKAVANTPSDTEIRFIAFSGEEEGLMGSSKYVSSLTSKEKKRIIGDIQLDMLGHYQSDSVVIQTTKGTKNLLVDMLNKQATNLLGSNLKKAYGGMSDHISFIAGGVPALLVTQNNMGVENHKVSDNTSIIDCSKIKTAGDIVLNVMLDVMSADTKGLAKKSRSMTSTSSSYTASRETIFYFNSMKPLNDTQIGGPGTLTKKKTNDWGWDMEYYTYQVKWFGMKTPLKTVFEYRALSGDKYLQTITINAGQSGFKKSTMYKKLKAYYGKPEYISKKKAGYEYIWTDKANQKQIILKPNKKNATLEIYDCHVGSGWDINSYDISKGITMYDETNAVPKELKLLEFIDKLTNKDYKYFDTFQVWSDGLSYQLGAMYPTVETINDKFTIRIDIDDVFDSKDEYRNFDKTLSTFVHEYGHVLTLNNTQTDISKKTEYFNYYDSPSYKAGSYIQAFYNRFYVGKFNESGNGYYGNEDCFVDEYAASNINEDIAESFMLFVLSNKPNGDKISEQKINFFYDYPQLVKIRNEIRANFNF